MTYRVVIIGGGPGGYEAAHVAAQLGADVTIVDSDGLGGSAVVTDCVPSKTLIATAEFMSEMGGASELGVEVRDHEGDLATSVTVDLAPVNARVKQLAVDQSADIARRLARDGVTVLPGAPRSPAGLGAVTLARGASRRWGPTRSCSRRRRAARSGCPARRRADPHVGAGL